MCVWSRFSCVQLLATSWIKPTRLSVPAVSLARILDWVALSFCIDCGCGVTFPVFIFSCTVWAAWEPGALKTWLEVRQWPLRPHVACVTSQFIVMETSAFGSGESESLSVVSDSLGTHGLYSPCNSPGQNTGVGNLSLLQGIFPTPGSNPGLRTAGDSLPAESQGKPRDLPNPGVYLGSSALQAETFWL